MNHEKQVKCELYNDHFQNYKKYGIPKAQLVIADIPYNLGNNAYASSNSWYVDGKIENGESGKAPAMIVFCSFQQLQMVIEAGKKHGFNHYIPLVFIKKTSGQVLKANMKIVGACEYALILYREKLPKFNNDGRMVLNWFNWETDSNYPKIHPTQKPIPVLKRLIEIFTDYGDVVIDPVAGSGTTLRAAAELHRSSYGFEIKKDFYKEAKEKMLSEIPLTLKL